MLFNSLEFLIFFPIVVVAFYAMPHRFRWVFLLAASYYFYMCWKAEYIVLILISTIIDYYAALMMGKTPIKAKRKKYLVLSLCGNLGILLFFKYANFFSSSFRELLNQFNIFVETPVWDYLLPVGISFYTFQTLSYSIDVYRGHTKPERHFGKFALYVSFFPQLVAGPIERSTRLLPELAKKVKFDEGRVSSGIKLMIWGFFKKVVIADRLAIYVNEAYNHPGEYQGLTLIVATIFFAYQIYCDFSGYSDIAIGAARVLGYDLMINFRQPYFAASISEFWQRWHISLSSWFKDYLYIPLGGNRVVKWRWHYNLMVVFVVSGLWHGANWTFVLWGFLHGFYLICSNITKGSREKAAKFFKLDRIPALHHLLRMAWVFVLVGFAWIFFRANSISEAFLILHQISLLEFSTAELLRINIELGWGEILIALASILFLEAVQIYQYLTNQELPFQNNRTSIRWAFYYTLVLGIVFYGVFNHTEFIYFQF